MMFGVYDTSNPIFNFRYGSTSRKQYKTYDYIVEQLDCDTMIIFVMFAIKRIKLSTPIQYGSSGGPVPFYDINSLCCVKYVYY